MTARASLFRSLVSWLTALVVLGASAWLGQAGEGVAKETRDHQRAEFIGGSLSKQTALVASSLAVKPVVSAGAKRPLDTSSSFRTATQLMPVLRFSPVAVKPALEAPVQIGVPLVGVVEIRV